MVFFHAGVAVPLASGAVVELDESHAALDEAARHEALATEGSRVISVEPIERFDRFRLAVEIDRLRCLRLHAEGEFVTLDARFEFGVRFAAGAMALVEPGEEVELGVLPLRIAALRTAQIGDRLWAGLEQRALVAGGHEAGAPSARTVDDHCIAVLDDDEARQAVVLRAETVGHPSAERRSSAKNRAGIHLADPAGVVDAVADTRSDHAQFIGDLRVVWQPVGNPQPSFAMLLPLPFALQQGRANLTHRRDRALEAVGERFAGELVEQRLRIKEIEVARSALHEQEDHVLGASDLVWDLADRWIATSGDEAFTRQGRKRHGAKTGARRTQEVAP